MNKNSRNQILVFLIMTLFTFSAGAQKRGETNLIAVGQGIAAPAITSPVNYSNGFTTENPAVAAQLAGPQLSLEYDTGDDNTGTDTDGFGAELGLGNGSAGLILGYYDRDCNNCDGRFGGIAGFGVSDWSIGLGYREEDTYSLGFLFNTSGTHRFGLVGDFFDGDQDGQDLTSYGLGYSYNSGNVVFALDASKHDSESNSPNDDVILVTPGIMIKSEWLALSLSYDMYTNDDNDVYDNDLWFGLGFTGQPFQLAIYHDYVNEWSFVGTFWF